MIDSSDAKGIAARVIRHEGDTHYNSTDALDLAKSFLALADENERLKEAVRGGRIGC